MKCTTCSPNMDLSSAADLVDKSLAAECFLYLMSDLSGEVERCHQSFPDSIMVGKGNVSTYSGNVRATQKEVSELSSLRSEVIVDKAESS